MGKHHSHRDSTSVEEPEKTGAPIFFAHSRTSSENNGILNNKQVSFNKSWLEHTYANSPYSFESKPYNFSQKFEVPKYYNEFCLAGVEPEISIIHYKTVQDLMSFKRITADNSKLLSTTIPNITDNFNENCKPLPNMRPHNDFLKLSLGKIDSQAKISGGYFALFDLSLNKLASPTVPFVVSNGAASFPQTNEGAVYFQNSKFLQNLSLICVIYGVSDSSYDQQTILAANLMPLYVKNEFVDRNSFPDSFIRAINSSFEDTTKLFADISSAKAFPLNFELNFSKYKSPQNKPIDFTYIWNLDPNKSLVVSHSKYPSIFTVPMIILTNMQIVWKLPPKAKAYQLKAYYLNNQETTGTTPGDPNLLSNENSQLTQIYESPVITANKEMSFPDSIQISVGDIEPSANSHIIINVLSYDNKVKGEVTEIIVIPLFVAGLPLLSGEKYFEINETNKLSKGYLKKPQNYIKDAKAPGKTYLRADIILHHSLFVPPKLSIVEDLNFSTIPSQTLIENLLPLIVRLLMSKDEEQHKRIYDLFQTIGSLDFGDELLRWAFDGFDPRSIDSKNNAYMKICNSFSKIFMQGLQLTDENNELTNFLKTSEIIVPFILALCQISLFYPSCADRSESYLINLLVIISQIIAKHMNVVREFPPFEKPKKHRKSEIFKKPPPIPRNLDEDFLKCGAIKMTDAFVDTVLNCSCFLSPRGMNSIATQFLKAISNESNNSNEPRNMSYLQIRFMMKLFTTPYFAECFTVKSRISKYKPNYVPINHFISTLFLRLFQSFAMDARLLIDSVATLFIRIILTSEILEPEKKKNAAIAVLPFLSLLYENFQSPILRNMPDVQFKYLLIATFIFGAAPEESALFFSGLELTFKNRFISFLVESTRRMISYAKENKDEGLHLLATYTRNVALFLFEIVKYVEECYEEFINLLSLFTDEIQPLYYYSKAENKTYICMNIYLVYNIINKALEYSPFYAITCRWVLNLATRKQHCYRCLVSAAILTMYKADFTKTSANGGEGNITLSSVETLDSLTNAMMSAKDDEIIFYKNVVDSIEENATMFERSLSKKIISRTSSALVVYDCIVRQKTSTLPPDIQARTIMEIADEYKDLPSMRMQWLRQIVRTNRESKDFISAFIAQIHVVALSCHILQSKFNLENNLSKRPKHLQVEQNILFTQPTKVDAWNEDHKIYFSKHDFAFIPTAMKEFDTVYDKVGLKSSLLIPFDVSYIIAALNEAISIGKEAKMFYTMRPLYSFLLRLFHRVRDAAGAAKIYKQYAEDEINVNRENVNYYFVEANDDEKRYIFTSNLSKEEFVKTLFHRFDKVVICESHKLECLSTAKTCVVEVKPIIDNSGIERQHAFTQFQSVVDLTNLKGQPKSSQIIVTTEEEAPHFAQSVKVSTVEFKEVMKLDLLVNEIKLLAEKIELASSDIEALFPSPELCPPVEVYSGDLQRLNDLVENAITGQLGKSMSEAVEHNLLNQSDFTPLISALQRLFAIYLRAVNGRADIKAAYDKQTAIYNDFCEKIKFGTPVLGTLYSADLDPMRDLEYNEYGGVKRN